MNELLTFPPSLISFEQVSDLLPELPEEEDLVASLRPGDTCQVIHAFFQFYKYFEHSGRMLYIIVSRLESLCLWTTKIWQGSPSPPTIRSPLQRLCPSRTLRVLTRALSSLCHWTVCAKLSLPDRSLFELEIWNKLQAECKFSMLILSYNLWIWRNGCRCIILDNTLLVAILASLRLWC